MYLKAKTSAWIVMAVGVLSLTGLGSLLNQPQLMASQGLVTQFQLVSESFQGVDDAAGAWLFDEGMLLDMEGNHVGYYQATYRTFSGTTSAPNAASVQTTLFFENNVPGQAPSNVTLFGAHTFDTGNQVGSIASAGGTLVGLFVGSQYELDGATNILSVTDNI